MKKKSTIDEKVKRVLALILTVVMIATCDMGIVQNVFAQENVQDETRESSIQLPLTGPDGVGEITNVVISDSSNHSVSDGTSINRDEVLNLAIDYTILNGQETVKANDSFYYQLPAGLLLNNITDADMTDKSGNIIGAYSIDNNMIVFHFTEEFISKNPSDINGYFNLSASLDTEQLRDQSEVAFQFDTNCTVDVNLNTGDVSGSSKQMTNNGDGTVTFQVPIHANANINNLIFTDHMGTDFRFVKESFKLDGNLIESENAAIDSNENAATITIPTVAYGDHTLSYTANIVDVTMDGTANKNTIEWNWEGHNPQEPGTADTGWINLSKSNLIEKSDSSVGIDGIINWTLTINGGDIKGDVSGAVITDTLGPDHSYVGTAYVKDSQGKIIAQFNPALSHPDNFYTFPTDAGKQAYTITYQTQVDQIPTAVGSYSYTNRADITPPGGKTVDTGEKTAGYKVEQKGILNKSVITSDSTTGIAKWKAVLDVSALQEGDSSKSISDVVFTDEIPDVWLNNANKETKIQEDTADCPIVVENASGILQKGTDYTISFELRSENQTLRGVNRMKIEFLKPLSKNVTITYYSISNCSSTDLDPGKSISIVNQANASYNFDGDTYNSPDSANWNIKNSNLPMYKSGTKYGWDEDEKAYINTWTVTANATNTWDNEGINDYTGKTVTIEDILPYDVEYVSNTAKLQLNYEANTSINNPKIDPITDNDGKITGTKLTWELTGIGKDVMKLSYDTKVRDAVLPSISNDTVKITNQVDMIDSGEKVSSTTGTVDLNVDQIKKTSDYTVNDSVIKYSVYVNPHDQDLVTDSAVITLSDTIPENVTLVPSSVKIYEGDTNTEISGCNVNYHGTSRILTITIPDNKYARICYNVQPNAQVGESLTIENTMSFLSGNTTKASTDTKTYTIHKSSAGATGDTNSITLKKIDEDDLTEELEGATFDLYKVDMSDYTMDIEQQPEGEKLTTQTKTTGVDGTIVFDKENETDLLKKDTLYYYVETNAPSGYQLDNTKHYFVLAGNSFETTKNLIYDKFPNLDCEIVLGGQTVNVTNEKQSGNTIQISKVGVQGSEELPGATLQIIDENGKCIEQWTTTSDIHTINKILSGTYTLREISAPDQYQLAEDISFTVNSDGTITSTTDGVVNGDKITMTDQAQPNTINISITKQWDDDADIAGLRPNMEQSDSMKMELYQKTANTAESIVANADDKLQIKRTGVETWVYTWTGLPENDGANNEITYSVKEAKVPTNYKVTYDANSSDEALNGGVITNAIKKFPIEFSKTEIDGTTGLDNAHLTLSLSSAEDPDTELFQIYGWDTDTGKKVKNLTAGNYILKETSAPEGYLINDNPIYFSVSSTGQVNEIDSNGNIINDSQNVQDASIRMKDIESVDFTITKSWADNENRGATRPTIDSDQIQFSLYKEGAEEELTDVQPSIIDNKDNTWTYTWSGLPKTDENGNKIAYYAQETKVPYGYEKNSATITNTLKEHKVQIQKISGADQSSIRGARLTVAYQTRPDIAIAGWNTDGTVHELNLGAGNYILRETVVPEGYLHSADIVFHVDADGKVTSITPNVMVDGIVTMIDQPIERKNISVTKKWDDGKNSSRCRPDSVTVSLYKDGQIMTDKTVTLNQDNNWTYTWENLPKYTTSHVELEYTVKEDDVSEGYLTPTISGDETNGYEIQNKATSFTITKKDASNDENLVGAQFCITPEKGFKLAGDATEVKLLDGSEEVSKTVWGLLLPNNSYKISEVITPIGYQKVSDFVIHVDADGKITKDTFNTDENIFVENNTIIVKDNRKLGSISLTKIDSDNKNQPLDGTTFTLYTDKDEKVMSMTTGEDGKIEFDNLAWGKYYVLETQTKKGYVKDDTKYEASIGNGKQQVLYKDLGNIANQQTKIVFNKTVLNQETSMQATLNLSVVDPTSTTSLAGATFGIYTSQTCAEKDAVKEKDGKAKIAVSDENGKVEFDQLPIGTYYVKEIASGSPKVIASKSVFRAVIDENGEFEKLTPTDLLTTDLKDNSIVNDVIRGTIHLQKVDEKDPSKVLSNSTYGLYRAANISLSEIAGVTTEKANSKNLLYSIAAQTDTNQEILVATATTDEEGRLSFDQVLTGVQYTIREMVAPSGSQVSKEPIQIQFSVDDTGTAVINQETFHMGNNGTASIDQDGNITWLEPATKIIINKKDEAGNLLGGATLRITKKDGTKIAGVEDWVSSTKEGHLIEGILVAGETYVLTEVEAPDGYEIAKPMEFTVSDKKVGPQENFIQIWEMIDEKIPATPSKTTNAAKTGDNMNIIPYLFLALAALAVIIIVIVRKKKRK